MRSFTSSSKVKLALFVLIFIGAVAAAEIFVRSASYFTTTNFAVIRNAYESDPTNAVFGDSHVLWVSHIPNFSFFGSQGQQPAELLRLIRYLYRNRAPRKIIIQADANWFGFYHSARKEFLTDQNLIDRNIPLFLTSAIFRGAIVDGASVTVARELQKLQQSFQARADEIVPPMEITTLPYVDHWTSLVNGNPNFNWTFMPAMERTALTINRVRAQNPRKGFQTQQAARDFEAAIDELKARGADICLFRTPVTQEYLDVIPRLQGTNYAAFDQYINDLAESRRLTHVDFRELPMSFGDEKFLNQDHLTTKAMAQMWPLVAKACFAG